MQGRDSTSIEHQAQDKVRIRSGEFKGQKGIIQAITSNQLELQLENGKTLRVDPDSVTNQSLAARKAWRTMRTQQTL